MIALAVVVRIRRLRNCEQAFAHFLSSAIRRNCDVNGAVGDFCVLTYSVDRSRKVARDSVNFVRRGDRYQVLLYYFYGCRSRDLLKVLKGRSDDIRAAVIFAGGVACIVAVIS